MDASNTKVQKHDAIGAFLSDIEPVFRGRLVSCVDLDANSGDLLEAATKSKLSLSHVLLVAPDKEAVARLQDTVADHPGVPHLRCLNVAVSGNANAILTKDANATSAEVVGAKAVEPHQTSGPLGGGAFGLDCKPFDDLVEGFPEKSVSILKTSAKARCVDALKSAGKAMSENRIDVVYIEAAIVPGAEGNTYLHNIDEIMTSHGYELFHTYGQIHYDTKDGQVIGCMSAAFLSRKIVAKDPIPLIQELAKLRADLREMTEASAKQAQDYGRKLQDCFAEIAQLSETALRKGAPPDMPMRPVVVPPSHMRFLEPSAGRQPAKKARTKSKQLNALFLVLVYFLGVATPLVF